LRHAGAAHCLIELGSHDGWVSLRVSDDGHGMPAQLDDDAIGIEGMRERALLAGGSLAVEARAGGGTTIRLTIPLEMT
jgi:two-component system sensor histidine kinase UhpB